MYFIDLLIIQDGNTKVNNDLMNPSGMVLAGEPSQMDFYMATFTVMLLIPMWLYLSYDI